ncbi:MAG: amino acid lyase [Acidobacteria bacterium]|nr:amino acid lyase [Acidobacteriota bacterium]
MKRRSFFALTGLAALPAGASTAGQVYASGDGIPHSTEDYARLVARLCEGGRLEADNYSLGGVVEALEKKFAEALGKESAVWMPTGTLANQLAVRWLAGTKRRVLVQAECHLYNDCGDCSQTLSGLHLIPLASGKAAFTLEEAERAAAGAADGRVPLAIGAIQIETPVRRKSGERFDFSEMKRIASWARGRRIGLHLDGARLYLESAYSGMAVAEYAALFDTVYISLYKYFNAASGAILACPKAMADELRPMRRMFGGGLHHVWPFAAVALHYFDGFPQRFQKAKETSETVITALAKDGNFDIERVPNGTNIFRLRVRGVNALVYQQRLDLAGITARAPESGEWYSMQVNETWTRRGADDILDAFRKGLG